MSQRPRRLARRASVVGMAAVLGLAAFALPASAEPTWLPVKDLSSGTPFDVAPEVAIGTNGTAVAVWGRIVGGTYTVVAAKRSAIGTWGSAVPISGSHADGQLPHAAVDAAGNASVIWSAEDGSGTVRAAHRSASANTWSAPVTLSASGGEADLAVDSHGNLLATWTNADKVYVARKTATGAWTAPAAISGTGAAHAPDIAFDGSGNATAVWHSFDGMQYDVRSARRVAGQAWGSPVTIANSADDELHPVLTVDHTGNAIAAWDHTGEGTQQVEAAYRIGGGAWSEPADVSAAGGSSHVADIDIDESGNVVAVWNDSVTEKWVARAATLLESGSWSEPVTLSEADTSTRANNVTLGKSGNAAVSLDQETDTGKVAQVVQRPAGGAWGAPMDLPTAEGQTEASFVKHDNQGNLTGVWYSGPGTDTTIQTRSFDAVGPVTSTTQPASTRLTATSFGTAWTSADRLSGVVSKDVRYRVAPWNGDFGDQTDWQTDTTANSATFTGTAGRTYCFSARGTDGQETDGNYSAEKCTATPLDDRSLTGTSGWTRGSSTSYYLNTYTSAKTTGATLTRTGVQAKHLSLVVASCSSCGKVRVRFNGTSLGTFDLASASTVRKKIVGVKTFDTVQTGTLTIEVVSATGKTVYIDGVIAKRT